MKKEKNEKIKEKEKAEWIRQNSVKTENELQTVLAKWHKGKKLSKEYADKVVAKLMEDINERGLYITKDGEVYTDGELLDMEYGNEDTGIAELE